MNNRFEVPRFHIQPTNTVATSAWIAFHRPMRVQSMSGTYVEATETFQVCNGVEGQVSSLRPDLILAENSAGQSLDRLKHCLICGVHFLLSHVLRNSHL